MDPIFIGLSKENKLNVNVKGYDSKDISYIPHNAKFLAETENGSLSIQPLGAIEKREQVNSSNPYTPRYLYLVDLIVRLDFLLDPVL